ncbi:MAG: hypothetical protein IK081_14295 [Lachnospiraceae bacterium]|nr:hypothetical protein [Lachnospiraceae bacterium]
MKKFKSIMLGLQAQSKSFLNRLYVDHYSSDPEAIEDEKVFTYRSLGFWFQGTGRRNAEKVLMMIALPTEGLLNDACEGKLADGAASVGSLENDVVPVGTYLLGKLEPRIQEWNENNKNDNKAREKAQFFVQKPGNRMLRRSGLAFDERRRKLVLRMLFQVPLINGVSVNGKAACRGVTELLDLVEETILCMDQEELKTYVRTYRRQQQIRSFLKANGYCAFVANGSILPREKDSDEPMQGAIPFASPKELEVEIPLAEDQNEEWKGDGANQTSITGMAIPCGITVITGGGYSGKSTLLDALEAGIYDHVPGDGREYVIAENSALKVYAEDGRPVSQLNLSAFFKFLPGKPLEAFSTEHASGSVSQASSILEAVSGGSKLLLIDEDKSATNFMIRDHMMRLLVDDEPIIPFTERVTELWKKKGVSTILVIGGSSEYLPLADQVILMKNFCPCMITGKVKELLQTRERRNGSEIPESTEKWQFSRRLMVKETSQPFLFFRTVETENERKVILDEYSADVTMLTAMSTHEQLCTLTVVMERLLTDPQGVDREILENVAAFLEDLLKKGKTGSIMPETQSWFYEEIRPLDALCCINRMRGAEFIKDL